MNTKLALVSLLAAVGVNLVVAVPAPEYVPPVTVFRPENKTMEQFKYEFHDLCPRYDGESEITDRRIYVYTTFEVSADQGNDQWTGRRADVSCVYQYTTTEYVNIGIDVAMTLGGDAPVTIDPIEMGRGGPVRA
ncbi:hypothetical protein I316_03601 [Kwoniella heveanensis BCC8398]|uniref:Uncharacterized protein n=1 Tax=Kwoniella heveanensis BCC8398 TaxID=1296120 RepID=A0A1B9GU34_9TREE|nr:hypothetical protein I316_03601 [Kwoniella heveanensis BCC8398]